MPRTKSSQTLTQVKLNFGSTKPKRTTTQNVKPRQTKILTGPKRTVDSSDESSDIEEIETLYSSGDESTSGSRKNQDVEAPKKASSTFKAARRTVESPAIPAQKVVENKGAPRLNENNSKYDAHYATVRQKMNYMPPIHCDGQSKVHEILRCFDMSYEFGPCVGVSRLERWERARLMGLNPPKEVKDILTTKQGLEQKEFSQSVLFNEV
ncbi:hypothetical protein C0993_004084 [Termitomyces sp. T159_Od127]|nr:hypothetical protein C0993_004084 [Termitomyces sp. T159_Od127]